MALSTPVTSVPGYQDQASVNSYHSSGSIGLFIAVMFVIIVLAALSCIFGRVCASEMAEGPDSSYDCLSWVRRSYQRSRCGFSHCIMREAKLDLRVKEGSQFSPPSSQP
ncbi:hypothetical protein MA16_Dca017824 [Dendrobium catenatum]|uniref:Uncharacterized protein n=1 Tax=Dendrobium catenatum TaxID=906689 RepID=A0A2I0XGB1_9ASPA|nr:hypothetical protein MA16_Dca017824 [Dendrobium catenatum]